MDNTDVRARAKERVDAMRGFYIHALITLPILVALFTIDALTGDPWWFYWPLLGLGIALGFHGFAVFGRGSFLGPEWEQRKIDQIVERS